MNPQQLQTIKAAILAETNPQFVAYRTAGQTGLMAEWLNGDSTTDAWLASADSRTLFEAMDITKYDALTAGKRDAWALMLAYAPINLGRNKLRKAIPDVWGTADAVPILTALREKARRIEVILGGATKSEQGVSGLDRNFVGLISDADVVAAVNLPA